MKRIAHFMGMDTAREEITRPGPSSLAVVGRCGRREQRFAGFRTRNCDIRPLLPATRSQQLLQFSYSLHQRPERPRLSCFQLVQTLGRHILPMRRHHAVKVDLWCHFPGHYLRKQSRWMRAIVSVAHNLLPLQEPGMAITAKQSYM